MKPIQGVVINEKQIRMKGGKILTLNHTFNLGANVLIFFDFTEMKPNRIELARHVYPGASLLPRDEEVYDDGLPDEGMTHDFVDWLCL
jgi:hypothetical protein